MNCYAAHLGNCSTKSSREHYISRSVLELAGKTVRISGFPWQDTSQAMDVGIDSLTSKILCDRHNSILSTLDESGKIFLFSLKSIFDAVLGDEKFTKETIKIEGDKLELWLLKVLCGITLVSGFSSLPLSWVEILFQKRPFPEYSGLSFFGIPGLAEWRFNLIRVLSVLDKHGNVAGAKFGIGGLASLLAFGKPNFEDPGIQFLYRPTELLIQKGKGIKRFEFSWGAHVGQGSITLRFDNIGDELTPKARPIVGKFRT